MPSWVSYMVAKRSSRALALLLVMPSAGFALGLGSMWSLYFGPRPPRNYAEALTHDEALYQAFDDAIRKRGILLSPGARGLADQRLCLATTEADVDATIEAAGEALLEAAGRRRS